MVTACRRWSPTLLQAGLRRLPCWANRVVAATRRPVQIKKTLHEIFLLGAEAPLGMDCSNADDCRTARPWIGKKPWERLATDLRLL